MGDDSKNSRDLADYEKKYADYPFEKHLVAYRKKKVIEQISKYPHKTILDVGCGLDPLFLNFSDFDRMVVLEPAELFFKKTQGLVDNSSDNAKIELVQALFEEYEFEPNTFDCIVVSSLLHELDDPVGFMALLAKKAGKGTVIHINTPNAYSFHRLLAKEMGLIKDVYERNETQIRFQRKSVFTPKDLEELGKKNGFELIEKAAYAFKPFTHGQLQDMLTKKIVSPELIQSLFAMDKYCKDTGCESFVDLRAP